MLPHLADSNLTLSTISALAGYNGTIFAYGQTGSGKTFTITGGAERYADRGIIPRVLTYLFKHYAEVRKRPQTGASPACHACAAYCFATPPPRPPQHPETEFTTNVSYLEIYNEHGFDLLNQHQDIRQLEDLPKVCQWPQQPTLSYPPPQPNVTCAAAAPIPRLLQVSLLEDGSGGVHLKNLSLVPVNNEEDALNALFLGDTHRMIAETPMNMASTRSHCIFTVHFAARDAGSATIRKAKLHLVDLAGSERVKKTNVGGTLLTEAKYINLSLHYLEQVWNGG
jgi:kinesin family protein 6/9